MKPRHPAWLVELHRQWYAARGKYLGAKSRPFARPWPKLLDDAGVISAEDVSTAGREASKLEAEGKITLKRHRYRSHLVEGICVPLEAEAWLRDLFNAPVPEALRGQCFAAISEAAAKEHPLYPELWTAWPARIRSAFEAGTHMRPFFWNRPTLVTELLDLTFRITERTWDEGTPVREASVAIWLLSKQLERRRLVVESCISSLLDRHLTLGMLGIVLHRLRVEIAGELILHFADGRDPQIIDELHGSYHLTTDLLVASSATTPAKRILTIENTETTLSRIASLNVDKETLILGCAYPTQGLRRLLELLPEDLPIYHFGDTDPAGFLILSKLRQVAGRPVTPFLMHRREGAKPIPLSAYDRSILPGLLTDPWLEDVRVSLQAISASKDKGDFEQESLGRPDLPRWPFYRSHPSAQE
ncbi:Wadjet anti-phage system protein JetD domain-containing protein [Haloferula sp. BvORR071]|uniref:Wadjet anti-phage system protein JetD domain-containing protein n=1 Tax=Haloferula sp. BvORR071 TaxID=1396141 RepID=UPI000556EAAC|nr:Wadjet anti-phage system protein JetD domain-containing protein [Haloferula sp. BvORR071]